MRRWPAGSATMTERRCRTGRPSAATVPSGPPRTARGGRPSPTAPCSAAAAGRAEPREAPLERAHQRPEVGQQPEPGHHQDVRARPGRAVAIRTVAGVLAGVGARGGCHGSTTTRCCSRHARHDRAKTHSRCAVPLHAQVGRRERGKRAQCRHHGASSAAAALPPRVPRANFVRSLLCFDVHPEGKSQTWPGRRPPEPGHFAPYRHTRGRETHD